MCSMLSMDTYLCFSIKTSKRASKRWAASPPNKLVWTTYGERQRSPFDALTGRAPLHELWRPFARFGSAKCARSFAHFLELFCSISFLPKTYSFHFKRVMILALKPAFSFSWVLLIFYQSSNEKGDRNKLPFLLSLDTIGHKRLNTLYHVSVKFSTLHLAIKR